MAIIAADAGGARARLHRWSAVVVTLAAAAAVAMASCTSTAAPPSPTPVPRPEAPPVAVPGPQGPVEPTIRVGLTVGAGSATVAGAAGLSVSDPSGARLVEIPAGEVWRVAVQGTGIVVLAPGGASSAPTDVIEIGTPDPNAPVLVNGRPYRGTIVALRDRTGVTVVDRLPMETYLIGVVSAEMGRRSPEDQEALRAQAIVSRTFALRNLGRWQSQGFDLYATVADQVYGGASTETPEGRAAVDSTRGQILTYGGAPIDAFFYSTCGGRTADGTEVFRGADRPYLRSVSDLADDGTAYCSLSPRFRWHEEWTGEALRATLQRTLPTLPAGGGSTAVAMDVSEVRDVRIAYRTPSGRVGQLVVGLRRGDVLVDGPNVRQVLRPVSGDVLRSNTFTLTVTRTGGRVSRLAADGAGAGHGVGMCQWGAVGRSRAGQDHERILAAYYPGAVLERLY
ncbi:MAG TPA: SpoIID/LytB domain-containing protein [Gemmatimonadales bacterium]|nr:SpoIID/LytB domain-containing protein [Gemmatimonadales bacterium]